MTLEDVFNRLETIDSSAQRLIRDVGITDDFVPWDFFAIRQDDPDEVFLRDTALDLMRPFVNLHEELLYLSLPCTSSHPLRLLPGGKYGYEDKDGRLHVLSCGAVVEALIPDRLDRLHWVRSRIEHNRAGYYLFDYEWIPLKGLTVRERRKQ